MALRRQPNSLLRMSPASLFLCYGFLIQAFYWKLNWEVSLRPISDGNVYR